MGAGSQVSLAAILCEIGLHKLGPVWLAPEVHDLLTTCGAGYATDPVIIGDSHDDYPINIKKIKYLCWYLDTHVFFVIVVITISLVHALQLIVQMTCIM